MDATPGRDYGGDEAHHLLTVHSLAEQRAFDVRDDYRERAYREFDAVPPEPEGTLQPSGALHEPHSIGLPLLAAPVYALGGERAVELLVAALLALAMAFGYLLARRVVPDPWGAGATLALGLSPPLVAHGTAVIPEPVVAAPLAAAALLAARIRESPGSRIRPVVCFVLLAAAAWFGPKFLPVAVVIGWLVVRALRRAGRKWLALVSAEAGFFGLALLVGLNEAIFGGPTPHSAQLAGASATGADTAVDYLERVWRSVALFLDRDYGLIRWAPVAALGFVGAWVLYRAARERLARAIAGLDEEHAVARMCAAAVLAAILTATLLVPTLERNGFPGRELIAVMPLAVPLAALGLRQAPRLGALAALLGVAGSVWLWVDARSGGGLIDQRPDAPWGPLVEAFPHFSGGVWPYVVLAAVLVALAAPIVREELDVRRRLG